MATHLGGAGGSSAGVRYDRKVEVDPRRAHVPVDAVAGDDKFVSGLATTLQVIDPARPAENREFPMAQTAPGRDEGTFVLDRYGAFLLRAVHRNNVTEVAESTAALSLPYPREDQALPPDRSLLSGGA